MEGDCLLPVVVFTFSKKKCEEAADFLNSQDLLSEKEKREVSASASGSGGISRYVCVQKAGGREDSICRSGGGRSMTG